MAPSAALQERIKQFEALDNSQSTKLLGSDRVGGYPPRRSAPAPARPLTSGVSAPSLDLLGEPISPTASQISVIQASVPYVPRKPRVKSPSPSPPNLGCNTSLIDLQDWVVEDGKGPVKSDQKLQRPVIAPPLPPRSSSTNSSKGLPSSSKQSSPALTLPNGSSTGTPNSLTVEHTYPPLARSPSQSNMRQGQGHVHASSTSSFHSVSLSSDGGTDGSSSVSNFVATYPIDRAERERESERDRESVDDAFSFETVSSTGIASPSQSSTHEWEKDFTSQSQRPEPPRLPQRKRTQANSPLTTSKPAPPPPPSRSTPTGSPQPSIRRVPPPPVHRDRSGMSPSNRISTMSTATSVSDRSSLFSNTTVTTAHTSISNFPQLLRPTPVPEQVRKRYERIFAANEKAQNRVIKKKLAASSKEMQNSRKGWRGLSVDLITALDDAVNSELDREIDVSDNGPGKLDGRIVLRIWSKSKLPKEKLREIWSECALPSQNYLDRDGFVKGMWRIDEELRRAQVGKKPTAPAPPRRTTVDSVYS